MVYCISSRAVQWSTASQTEQYSSVHYTVHTSIFNRAVLCSTVTLKTAQVCCNSNSSVVDDVDPQHPDVSFISPVMF